MKFGRRRIDDVAPAALHVVVRPDADGRHAALGADHMLHGRKELGGQAAVSDDDQADHSGTAKTKPRVASLGAFARPDRKPA